MKTSAYSYRSHFWERCESPCCRQISTAHQRHVIDHAVAHLEHALPGQAPILNFVHQNNTGGSNDKR